MMFLFSTSLLLGIFAGLSAGLFGIGGGLIIVPVLVMLFTQQHFPSSLVMIMAIATSLATIICTGMVSAWSHHRLEAVLWPRVFSLAPGIVLGSVMGAVLADAMPKQLLRLLFLVYLLYAAYHLAKAHKPNPGQKPASKTIDAIAGFITGCLSAILGIGGGTLVVPYLVYYQTPMRNAVAIASACGWPIAVTSTVSYIWLGWFNPQLPTMSIGYVYLPAFLGIVITSIVTAPLGAKLANHLPAQQLKRYFSLLMLVMAVKLAWPYAIYLQTVIASYLQWVLDHAMAINPLSSNYLK
jgi:uncharacterized protein